MATSRSTMTRRGSSARPDCAKPATSTRAMVPLKRPHPRREWRIRDKEHGVMPESPLLCQSIGQLQSTQKEGDGESNAGACPGRETKTGRYVFIGHSDGSN